MRLFLRTTKFPYFFWSFNKAFRCEIDLKEGIYKNLDKDTEYRIQPFNYYIFLMLKYLPLCIVFYFCFNIYDFNFNKRMVISYMFAVLLVVSVNVFENFARIATSSIILISAGLVGIFMMNEPFIAAYVIKYFILLTSLIFFLLDFKVRPYNIVNENNKVLSHILIPIKAIKLKADSNEK